MWVFSLCWMDREIWEFSFADPAPVTNTDGAMFELVLPIHENSM